MARRYLDARLALFAVLAIGASFIAAHGSLGFFSFIVGTTDQGDPAALAWLYMLVVAVGIIGMAAGGAMSMGWERAGYYAGMLLFLVLETLANYFFGQEHFTARVVADVASGSDLAGLARDPFWGRFLVVLYLSLASIAVAAFTHKAAHRFAELRTAIEAEDEQVARVADLDAEIASLRDDLQQHKDGIANRDKSVASWRATAEKAIDEARGLEETIEQIRGELREARTGFAEEVRASDERAEQVAKLEAANRALRAELADARAGWEERPSAPTRAAVVAYSMEQQRAGRSRSEVAKELGFAEGTIREWEKVATNGHAVAE